MIPRQIIINKLKMNNHSGTSTLQFQAGKVFVTLSMVGLSESHTLFAIRDLVQKMAIDEGVKPPVEQKLKNRSKFPKSTVKEN
jgi:hypothetical protein